MSPEPQSVEAIPPARGPIPEKYIPVAKKYAGCIETFASCSVVDVAAAAMIRYKP
jgi:hypothetical protein